jgi:2'-5' RNA ligase
VRLFLSLRPPAHARAHLAAALAGLRTTDVAQWHLTLAFLGEVPSEQPLLPGVGQVVARTPRLVLRLRGGGVFRGQGVLYARPDGDLRQLRRLALDLAAVCRDAGVPLEDRPYRPHLTVARRVRAATALDGYEGPVWTATEVELVRSHLGTTARHEVLQSFPLRG